MRKSKDRLVVLSTTGDLSAFVAPENSKGGPVHARSVGLRGLKSPSQNKGRDYYLNTEFQVAKRLLYLARALWQKFFFLPASEGLTLFGFGSRERRRIHLDLNSRLESPILFRLMTAHLMNSTKLKEKKEVLDEVGSELKSFIKSPVFG